MPPIRFKPKQRHSAISDDVKHQICEWSTANKSKRHEEIAKHFNEKHKEVKFPALEHAMSLWVENVTASGGLFYRMSPSETLSTKPVPGRKKDKSRVTVLLR
ncbi:hypothetical protein RhiirA5_438986 [Rhizophagus irregularis]|uniref:ARS-binding protein 1 N-terminal domain-containing protein n=1 Tax=Rhizophagus irregularis TaxID=588596 RepID=A0A2N0NIG5_9GLOM|nr:hypothetical protein RhiirA5_438986 [Rhizophagus irregularis]